MFGARHGIYRKSNVGERRGLKEGTYVACKAGILVATENAVLARTVESVWSVDEDRSTLFTSASGDESFNNKKLTDFADVTQQKKVDKFRVHPAREAEMDCTPSWSGHWRTESSPNW